MWWNNCKDETFVNDIPFGLIADEIKIRIISEWWNKGKNIKIDYLRF